jgi:hypothetical protein
MNTIRIPHAPEATQVQMLKACIMNQGILIIVHRTSMVDEI